MSDPLIDAGERLKKKLWAEADQVEKAFLAAQPKVKLSDPALMDELEDRVSVLGHDLIKVGEAVVGTAAVDVAEYALVALNPAALPGALASPRLARRAARVVTDSDVAKWGDREAAKIINKAFDW